MAGVAWTDAMVWLLVVVLSGATYLIRFSFIALFGVIDDIPPWFSRVLRFIPVAVLAALAIPRMLYVDGALGVSLGNDRLIAGVLGGVVAWRTESVVATVGVGLLALFALGVLR